jgi:hypothetical protein
MSPSLSLFLFVFFFGLIFCTGVNFMEKTISIRNTEITFSIWDLGGQREFVNMLPLVCNDAVAILFMFDLTRKSTLNSIKEWYRQGRGFNKTAIPFLVGTKYDHFVNFPREDQEEISNQVNREAPPLPSFALFFFPVVSFGFGILLRRGGGNVKGTDLLSIDCVTDFVFYRLDGLQKPCERVSYSVALVIASTSKRFVLNLVSLNP